MKRAAARMRREVQNPACRIIRKRSARIGRRLHRGEQPSRWQKSASRAKFGGHGKLVVRAGWDSNLQPNCHERLNVDRLAGPDALGRSRIAFDFS